MTHQDFLHRCLILAEQGFGSVSPNPMVGSVVVNSGVVIGEGFHRKFGAPHAEVEAVSSVSDKSLLKDSTLYVNLEPCSHHGKTPPCVDLIIESSIKIVVIGAKDPNPQVAGKGIEVLKQHGIEVICGVLEAESRELNRRFYTFHEKKRPYYILKWAETADGFIARKDFTSKWISSERSRALVHKWRSEESAIMVGTYTAWYDNPKLIAHGYEGKNPTRIVIDREQRVPTSFYIFDESAKTILFNAIEKHSYPGADLVKIDFTGDVLSQISSELYNRGIQSVIVEGGAKLIQSFIDTNLWDEARIFKSLKKFGSGISAPLVDSTNGAAVENGEGDTLAELRNQHSS